MHSRYADQSILGQVKEPRAAHRGENNRQLFDETLNKIGFDIEKKEYAFKQNK